MVPGAFVRVLFPTHEQPRHPGLLHIGYIFAHTPTAVLVAYTTSQPWPRDQPLPMGSRFFSGSEAASLNQSRPFILRMDVLARLRPTAAWFPHINAPDQGVVAIAPAKLREELDDLASHLVRRHQALIQMRGT
ncbi:MAG: hypothetical protein U1E70_22830 [Acetobacteraceae bacterium]|nr:hypothetical protein [Pseudomonadota bacterium]